MGPRGEGVRDITRIFALRGLALVSALVADARRCFSAMRRLISADLVSITLLRSLNFASCPWAICSLSKVLLQRTAGATAMVQS